MTEKIKTLILPNFLIKIMLKGRNFQLFVRQPLLIKLLPCVFYIVVYKFTIERNNLKKY